MTIGEKITFCILGLNALINMFIIQKYDQYKTSSTETQASGGRFWFIYLLFVPFFITNSIIKEINNKAIKKQKLLLKDYDKLISAWNLAAADLNIKIQTPVIIIENDKELRYPILIEQFGSKKGTIIVSINDNADLDLIQKNGYYCAKINPLPYSNYQRDLFISKLNELGFYGGVSDKPSWNI